jgi:hypothetical protein
MFWSSTSRLTSSPRNSAIASTPTLGHPGQSEIGLRLKGRAKKRQRAAGRAMRLDFPTVGKPRWRSGQPSPRVLRQWASRCCRRRIDTHITAATRHLARIASPQREPRTGLHAKPDRVYLPFMQTAGDSSRSFTSTGTILIVRPRPYGVRKNAKSLAPRMGLPRSREAPMSGCRGRVRALTQSHGVASKLRNRCHACGRTVGRSRR